MLRFVLASLKLIMLCFVSAVVGADFYLGVDAYNRGDYRTAYREFSVLAQDGHIDAQNNLGVMLNTGRGVERNFAEAAYWYRKAAERGHASAQTNLANLYATGKGVEKSEIIAYAWFSIAASQGTERARHNLERLASRLSAAQLQEAQDLLVTHALVMSPVLPHAAASSAAQQQTAIPVAPSASGEPATPVPVYGPVAAGETLWSVAEKTRPGGVSVQQMMLALLHSNPEAFAAPRVDRLQVHSQLRIPSKEKALEISAEQAKAEIERQLSD